MTMNVTPKMSSIRVRNRVTAVVRIRVSVNTGPEAKACHTPHLELVETARVIVVRQRVITRSRVAGGATRGCLGVELGASNSLFLLINWSLKCPVWVTG